MARARTAGAFSYFKDVLPSWMPFPSTAMITVSLSGVVTSLSAAGRGDPEVMSGRMDHGAGPVGEACLSRATRTSVRRPRNVKRGTEVAHLARISQLTASIARVWGEDKDGDAVLFRAPGRVPPDQGVALRGRVGPFLSCAASSPLPPSLHLTMDNSATFPDRPRPANQRIISYTLLVTKQSSNNISLPDITRETRREFRKITEYIQRQLANGNCYVKSSSLPLRQHQHECCRVKNMYIYVNEQISQGSRIRISKCKHRQNITIVPMNVYFHIVATQSWACPSCNKYSTMLVTLCLPSLFLHRLLCITILYDRQHELMATVQAAPRGPGQSDFGLVNNGAVSPKEAPRCVKNRSKVRPQWVRNHLIVLISCNIARICCSRLNLKSRVSCRGRGGVPPLPLSGSAFGVRGSYMAACHAEIHTDKPP